MSLTNEDLLSISQLLDSKLKPVNAKTSNIELLLENDILPRLQNIESCYTSTYCRYSNGISELESLKANMDIIEKVVAEHSVELQKLA